MIIDELKTYLRVDGNEEDAFLASLLSAANGTLKSAGVIEPSSGDELELYNLAIQMICAHWYENRTVVTAAENAVHLPLGVQSIILQLRTHTVLVVEGES